MKALFALVATVFMVQAVAQASVYDQREQAAESARRAQIESDTTQERGQAQGTLNQIINAMAARHGGAQQKDIQLTSIDDKIYLAGTSFVTGDGLACQFDEFSVYGCGNLSFSKCLMKARISVPCLDGQNRNFQMSRNGRVKRY